MLGPLLGCTALTLLFATLLARVRLRWWWIRSVEFPRLQLATAAALCALLSGLILPAGNWQNIALAASLVSLLLQLRYIIPWTRCWPVQVKATHADSQAPTLTLLIANVLTPNRQSAKLLAMIERHQPDVVLTLESDQWWQEQLDSALHERWPHSVKVPLDNLYGMHLYSRLPLSNPQVKWLIQDDIPSIHTRVTLDNGEQIRFYALHPRPPAPSESEKSLWRDAELLWVGQEVHEEPFPTIVAGDLNDVAWSRTTRLFCRVSGMLDPRRGRGLFSTFHAHYPVLRWPLDHVFVSEEFTLTHMERLEDFGSDHFPILATLSYQPARQDEHDTPSASSEERQEASATIAQGKSEEQQT